MWLVSVLVGHWAAAPVAPAALASGAAPMETVVVALVAVGPEVVQRSVPSAVVALAVSVPAELVPDPGTSRSTRSFAHQPWPSLQVQGLEQPEAAAEEQEHRGPKTSPARPWPRTSRYPPSTQAARSTGSHRAAAAESRDTRRH